MKRYAKEITSGFLIFAIASGLAFWFFRHEPNATLKISIALIAIALGIFVWIRNVITKKQNLAEGSPAEDEFTKLIRIYAWSQAFHYSMYLWFAIFLFHTHFRNQEEMLGLGIMGSAAIYGGSILYFKSKGGFSEE